MTIKTIECAIVDARLRGGLGQAGAAARSRPASGRGRRLGAGRAACAQQLARAGHEVHVFEKHAKAGGLLRYGIPDFKMEKHSSTGAWRRCRRKASRSTTAPTSA